MKVLVVFLGLALLGCNGITDAVYFNQMPHPPLKLIRNPYLQNSLSDSLTVAWKTSNAATSCFIEYYEYGQKPIRKKGVVERQRINTLNYVTLKNLEPGKKYFYRVYTNNELMHESDLNFFYTSETYNDTFSFITIADAGQPASWHGHCEESAREVMEFVKRPNLGLGLGDIVYPDGESELVDDNFFTPFQDVFANTPFFPVPGNHDHKSKLSENFKQEWMLPGNEQYYSFDFANTHFIGLDSGDDFGFTNCDEQMEWFENDLLCAQSKYDWIIVFLHHHGITCSYKGDENDVLRIYPLLAKYNVDLVLNGHIHSYERLKPMDSLGMVIPEFNNTEFVYPEIRNGFISVTAGTTGKLADAKYEEGDRSCLEKYIVKESNELSVVRVGIEKRKLNFELISSEDGSVLDHFTIDKSQSL